MGIENMSAKTGRMIKENGVVVNVADRLFGHSEPYATHARPNDTTPYTANDVVGESPATIMTFADVSPIAGSDFIIVGVDLEVDVISIPSGMSGFLLHLYDRQPTAIADNSPFNLPSADRSKYLGYIEIDTPKDLGDTLYICMNNVNFKRKLYSNSKNIYGMLQTIGAYTPTANASKTVKLHTLGV